MPAIGVEVMTCDCSLSCRQGRDDSRFPMQSIERPRSTPVTISKISESLRRIHQEPERRVLRSQTRGKIGGFPLTRPLPWFGERADGGEGYLEFRCRKTEVLGNDFIAVVARAASDAGAAVDTG